MSYSLTQRTICAKVLLAVVGVLGALQFLRAADDAAITKAATQTSVDDAAREITHRIFTFSTQGDFSNEQVARRELVALFRKEYGDEHWRTIEEMRYLESVQRTCELNSEKQQRIAKARTLCARTEKYERSGELWSALSSSEEALEIYREVMGESDMFFSTILARIGSLQKSLGLDQKAKHSWSKVLELRLQLVGDENLENASLMVNLASISIDLNNLKEAEKLLLRSLKIYKIVEPSSVDHGIAHYFLARTYNLMQNFQQAESAATDAIQILVRMIPKQYPFFVKSQLELARSYMGQEEYAKAVTVYERVVNIFESFKKNPPPAAMQAEVFDDYAAALRANGDEAGAEENAAKAAKLRVQPASDADSIRSRQ